MEHGKRRFESGEVLVGAWTIDYRGDVPISAIETSVMWRTCGKGQSDIGVHFFERAMGPFDGRELAVPRKFSTVLPPSPLTYDGQIVKIEWCVRITVLLKGNRQFTEDLPFQLGHVGTDWMNVHPGGGANERA